MKTNRSESTLEVVRGRYPNALSTSDTVDALLDLMCQRLGIAPSKIMLADSICSDDLNIIEYPRQAYEMLGPFKLGGLDGFPFAGLTGMGAFAHHVPAEGAVFVFHGPHIGVSKEGDTGRVLRPGQTRLSPCCGAVDAAIDKMMANAIVPGEITDLDYQQNTLEQILLPHRDRIAGARCAVAESTEVMYAAIEERIDVLVSRTTYPCRYLVLVGGVLINSDYDVGSFCSLRRLICIDTAAGRRINWLDEFLDAAASRNRPSSPPASGYPVARRMR
jgi:Limiting CO2-inducible proteins B/C beta carbonyic anhydrases